MLGTITIDRRFRGPPESGNGGYVAGRLASFLTGAVEVTLRLPPPLDRLLEVTSTASDAITMLSGETVVAVAAQTEFEATPPIVAYADAVKVSRPLDDHGLPMCFVCGPEREDGLRIFAAPVGGPELVAAPWTPPAEFARDGVVLPEIVWSALDCPGGFAWLWERDFDFFLLGRMAAKVTEKIVPGERYVAVGWRRGREGRKLYSGSALLHESGRVCGVSVSTWILPPGNGSTPAGGS